MTLVIHCDKCDSTDVLHEEIRHKPPEEHKTMSQIVEDSKKPSISYGMLYYTHYRMVCKNCGYIVKYHDC